MTSEAVQLIVMAISSGHITNVGTWKYSQQVHYPNWTIANVTILTGIDRLVFVADKFVYTVKSHFIYLDNILVNAGSCNVSGKYSDNFSKQVICDICRLAYM